jgi:uncharacterized protein (TIGR02231 family)
MPSAKDEGVASGTVMEPAMEMVKFQVSEQQLGTEFTVSVPYTITSDNQEHQVDLQSYDLTAFQEYFAAPKLDRDAFLTAGITGWSQLSIMPGQANVYFDNAYVGESYINPAETGDTLYVSLGRDKRIIIKRDKLKELSSTKFFGGNREKAVAYEITVRNTRKESVKLTIEDQLPVSQDKDIEVTAGELSGAERDETTGKLRLTMTLSPEETKKIRFSFNVKYPKDKQVIGL